MARHEPVRLGQPLERDTRALVHDEQAFAFGDHLQRTVDG